MPTTRLRPQFILFHVVLSLALAFLSVRTVADALHRSDSHGGIAVAVLSSIEGLGALLLLFPPTLKPGGVLLLLTMGIAIVLHGLQLQVRADLLVYSAGVLFVMAHGGAWSSSPESGGASTVR